MVCDFETLLKCIDVSSIADIHERVVPLLRCHDLIEFDVNSRVSNGLYETLLPIEAVMKMVSKCISITEQNDDRETIVKLCIEFFKAGMHQDTVLDYNGVIPFCSKRKLYVTEYIFRVTDDSTTIERLLKIFVNSDGIDTRTFTECARADPDLLTMESIELITEHPMSDVYTVLLNRLKYAYHSHITTLNRLLDKCVLSYDDEETVDLITDINLQKIRALFRSTPKKKSHTCSMSVKGIRYEAEEPPPF